MKMIYVFLASVFITLIMVMCAKKQEIYPRHVDEELIETLNEVIELFEDYNLSWNRGISYEIYLGTFPDGTLGANSYVDGDTHFIIGISKESPNHTVTLLHELGHLHGLIHGDCEIMESGAVGMFKYDMWEFHKESYLKVFFELL